MADTATNYANLQQARLADAKNGSQYYAAARAAKMGGMTATLLILVALGFDGIQAFLDLIIIGVVLNWIVGIIAWLTFFIWLKSLGMSGGIKKDSEFKMLIFLGAVFGFELLPLINALPGWTAFAVGVVVNEFGSRVFEKVPLVNRFIKQKNGKNIS